MKTIHGFAAALAFLIPATAAVAQTIYPEKPIRMLVGYVAGGAADITGRVLADKLSESFGKPVVVENVAGAAGNVAGERVAKAAPDGYTLLLAASNTIVINPSLYEKMPLDPAKDLVPISAATFTPNILVVNNDVP